jgi:hypothetical protein
LIQEARMPKSEKPVQTLEDAVADVIEDEPKIGTK